MEDLLKFGGAIFGVLLFLLAALFVVTRFYIHSIKKWMRTAQGEIQAVRTELEAISLQINAGSDVLESVEKPEAA